MAKPKYKKQYVEDLLTYFFKFIEMRDDPDEGDKAERQGFLLMEPGVDGVYTRIPQKPSGGYPTLTKFAIKKGVSPRTITNWRKKYPDFDEACEFAEAVYKDILEERALTGKWDSKTAMKILELRAAARKEGTNESEGNGVRLTINVGADDQEQRIEIQRWTGEVNEDTEY